MFFIILLGPASAQDREHTLKECEMLVLVANQKEKEGNSQRSTSALESCLLESSSAVR